MSVICLGSSGLGQLSDDGVGFPARESGGSWLPAHWRAAAAPGPRHGNVQAAPCVPGLGCVRAAGLGPSLPPPEPGGVLVTATAAHGRVDGVRRGGAPALDPGPRHADAGGRLVAPVASRKPDRMSPCRRIRWTSFAARR